MQVSFRKRATNYRALLWKLTYKDKASYGSSPPCSSLVQSLRKSSKKTQMHLAISQNNMEFNKALASPSLGSYSRICILICPIVLVILKIFGKRYSLFGKIQSFQIRIVTFCVKTQGNLRIKTPHHLMSWQSAYNKFPIFSRD